MATLGTQNISTSYVQLIKTSGLTGIDGTIQTITDGNNVSSALQLSTTGVNSTGTLNAVGATTLASSLGVTGAVTLSSSLGVTGAATLSSSLGVTGAATLSSSLGVTGAATFSSSISATTGTVTIGTATISTATISTATISTATISTATISTAIIPTINGVTTFATGFTSSTGTNTLGTVSISTATIGTESVGISTISSATFGTARITGSTGGVTAFNYGTAAFTGATLQDLDSATSGSNTTTGTFTVSGAAIGDIVLGGLNSLSSSSGTAGLGTAGARMISQFRVEGSNVIRYTILNTDTVSHGTIPAGTLYATAMRFTT